MFDLTDVVENTHMDLYYKFQINLYRWEELYLTKFT